MNREIPVSGIKVDFSKAVILEKKADDPAAGDDSPRLIRVFTRTPVAAPVADPRIPPNYSLLDGFLPARKVDDLGQTGTPVAAPVRSSRQTQAVPPSDSYKLLDYRKYPSVGTPPRAVVRPKLPSAITFPEGFFSKAPAAYHSHAAAPAARTSQPKELLFTDGYLPQAPAADTRIHRKTPATSPTAGTLASIKLLPLSIAGKPPPVPATRPIRVQDFLNEKERASLDRVEAEVKWLNRRARCLDPAGVAEMDRMYDMLFPRVRKRTGGAQGSAQPSSQMPGPPPSRTQLANDASGNVFEKMPVGGWQTLKIAGFPVGESTPAGTPDTTPAVGSKETMLNGPGGTPAIGPENQSLFKRPNRPPFLGS